MWFLRNRFHVFKSALGRKSGFRRIFSFNIFWLAAVKAKPNCNGNKNEREKARYILQHNSEKNKRFTGFKDT
jgi:hypothetical protein